MSVQEKSPVATKMQSVNYTHNGVELKGFLATPPQVDAKHQRPAVLIVHEWWGVSDYIKSRTEQVAALGYIAFALDMYGQGKHTQDVEQAKAWSSQFYGSAFMAQRARAGLDVLAKDPRVDASRIVVIGYCFGGTVAIDLAYSGAPLVGAVSFHGTPNPPTAEQGKATRARLLFLNGVKDPMYPSASREALTNGLNQTAIHWEMINYSDAVHAFTNPKADELPLDGVGYNKRADRQSWLQLQSFLSQVFGLDQEA